MSLLKFFEEVCFQNEENKKLWDQVRVQSSFEARKPLFSFKAEDFKTLPKASFQEGEKFSYLPIEFLKEDQSFFLKEEILLNQKACFLSSGTTSQNRSKSYFTKDGLLLFKLESLKTFYDLLLEFFSEEQALSLKGVSFVPSTSVWKTSSLAQMVGWFSEFWPTQYTDHLSFEVEERGEPIWLFATALQLKDLVDRGRKLSLPKGSLVIETGGLKSSKESFSREELFRGISKIFSISSSQIVSEYSMCELACQAYDFSKEGKPLSQRSYLFPSWVSLAVSKPLGSFFKEGEGCLVIGDPLRVDYPVGLRVQDQVQLSSTGHFTLEGRVPSSVLKGCSLLAEDLLSSDFGRRNSSAALNKTREMTLALLTEKEINEVFLFLDSFFKKESSQENLLEEFSSKLLVKEAIRDFLEDFPKGLKEWDKILKDREGSGKWLLILPNTHAFAAFYPIVFAYFARISLSVRLPRSSPVASLVKDFVLSFGSKFSFVYELLPSSLRIPSGIESSEYEAIMAYGSDETFLSFKNELACPVQFYGSTLAASLVSKLDAAEIKSLVKDSLALGQRGCFSSRLVFCLSSWEDFEKEKSFALKIFEDLFKNDYQLSVPKPFQQACEHERIRFLRQEGARDFYWKSLDNPLVLFYETHEEVDLKSFLSGSPFVIPIVFCSLEISLNLLEKEKTLRKLSLSKNLFSSLSTDKRLAGKELSFLGHLNKTLWDGKHQRKALFKLT